MYKHFLLSILIILLLSVVGINAFSLDAQVEEIYFKIVKGFSPETDPNTLDADGNSIPDRAHARLLDRVLRDENVPNHEILLSIYYFNWARIKIDNTLGNRCIALQQIYGITCDELERFCAGIITIGEPKAIQYFVQGALSEFGVTIDLKNYNLMGGIYLRGSGDLDGDRITNKKEYELAEGDFDLFVEKAITPEEHPGEGEGYPQIDENVPLVVVPPLNLPVNYGDLSLKTYRDGVYTAENIGTEPVPLRVWILGEPEFHIIGDTEYLIEPQQKISFIVRFQPKKYGYYSAILVYEIYGKRYYSYLGGKSSVVVNIFSCGIFNHNSSKNNIYTYLPDLLFIAVITLVVHLYSKSPSSRKLHS
ncbi:MAG: hypothetical protein N3G21_00730 [Candidatus Hydrogenedentes bacterium]|nr:hypothetical protein [Candidatus Hydrogenedentota bacterium]